MPFPTSSSGERGHIKLEHVTIGAAPATVAQGTKTELLEAARKRRIRFTEARKAYGSPRSVSSNAHGFRVAVHRVTGEIRILYSVQSTDAGVVINPAQVRGRPDLKQFADMNAVYGEFFHSSPPAKL